MSNNDNFCINLKVSFSINISPDQKLGTYPDQKLGIQPLPLLFHNSSLVFEKSSYEDVPPDPPLPGPGGPSKGLMYDESGAHKERKSGE